MKTNHSKKRLLILVTITGLLSITVFTKAYAASDAKVYPGWMCRGQTYDASQLLRYTYDGSIINGNSNGGAIVLCPVVRDVLNTAPSSSGPLDILAVEKVTVNFTNNNLTRPVTCTLRARLGEIPVVRHIFNSSPMEVIKSYFDINMPKENNPNTNKAFYTMHCFLPPKNGPLTARIHSYSVQETSAVFK